MAPTKAVPMDITDPKIISYLNSIYDKEKVVRVQWNNKNQERIIRAATLGREPTNYVETDVITHNMKEGLAGLSREYVATRNNRKKIPIRDAVCIPGVGQLKHGHSIPEVGLGDPKDDPRLERPDTNLNPDPVMKPDDPELKKQLYSIEPNRKGYLKKRFCIKPEDKYYFPECTYWDYGWRLGKRQVASSGDSEIKVQRNQFHRINRIQREMQNHAGPQPDPIHYKSPEDCLGLTKCFK